jgi:hypothetical protein
MTRPGGDERHLQSKAELIQILHRLAVPQETIDELDARLPDPVDLDAAGSLLQSYGLTRDAVISRLGGSP